MPSAVASHYALSPFGRDEELWQMYKKAEASFWTVEEVDLAGDAKDWARLTEEERGFVKRVLAFFASADLLVADNALGGFATEVDAREAKFFYAFQAAIENIHAEMYTEMIVNVVSSPAEQRELLDAALCDGLVRDKVRWMERWMASSRPLVERQVAFACVEGIFFSAAFCSIFWLRKRGLMPGLCFSNDLISRDEGLHRDFACLLYRRAAEAGEAVAPATVRAIVREAVELEERFVDECLHTALIGINATSMRQYVRFVADHLLLSLGLDRAYGDENPFEWMELISLQGKTNFFEKRVPDYRLSCVGAAAAEREHVLVTDADF